MSDDQDFEVVVGDLISSASSDYEVQAHLGCGVYGEVAQCKKLTTNETVALKIFKTKECIEVAKEEKEILKRLKELNSDKFNIVRWNDSFTHDGRFCLEFEKLDMSLMEFQQRRCFRTLRLVEIRPIIQQLATALEFLKSAGIIHADLKPENIMMVDHIRQPMRVKVIDFGLSFNSAQAWTGAIVQTLWYRAPEILLGSSFDEAIDVWSLGCIAAEMLMGTTLFPANDEYDMMRHILYTIGRPPDHVLSAGVYTETFFSAGFVQSEPRVWRFMSALEVRNFTCRPRMITSLDDLKRASYNRSKEDASADACDRASFVDLLTKMLTVDASERITPSQILQHPFLTMSHLTGTFDNNFYVKSSVKLMSVCQHVSSDDGKAVAQASFETGSIRETADGNACPADHRVQDEARSAGLSGGEQNRLQSTVISGGTSPAKKRKRDGDDESEYSNRHRSPDAAPAQRRSNECQDAAPTETGDQTSPRKSPLLKRKRDDDDPGRTSDSSPAKKRQSLNLNKELTDSIKKLLSSTETWSSSTPVNHLKRRKSADEEASGSKQETSPVKKRRQSLDGGEGLHLKQY